MKHVSLRESMSWGILVWHVPLPVPLMQYPLPHGWYVCPGQAPKAANPPLLSAGVIIWPPTWFPLLPWRTLQHIRKPLINSLRSLECQLTKPVSIEH